MTPTPILSIFLIATVCHLSHAFAPNANMTPAQSRIRSNIQLFSSSSVVEYDTEIASCKEILRRAAITKSEDPDLVLTSLESLEKTMRQKRKAQGDSVSQQVLDNLTGEWRLIFTTGTKKTQDRYNTKINYFPLKALQSFDATTEPMKIENGIYAGDFCMLRFNGDFEFSLRKSKLEFEFDQITILGFTINLKKDEAAKIGASTGLGSDSNVKNAEKGKKAFFNWISADEDIATARGGGGGIALWQRIQ